MESGKLTNIVVIDDDHITNFITGSEIRKYALTKRLLVFRDPMEWMRHIMKLCRDSSKPVQTWYRSTC